MAGSPFPPHDAAADFYASAAKYWPGRHPGALFDFEPAVKLMGATCWYWANGWKQIADHIAADLQTATGVGGLHPDFVSVLASMYKLYFTAAQIAQDLPSTFYKLHVEPMTRARTPGAQVSNVPV